MILTSTCSYTIIWASDEKHGTNIKWKGRIAVNTGEDKKKKWGCSHLIMRTPALENTNRSDRLMRRKKVIMIRVAMMSPYWKKKMRC